MLPLSLKQDIHQLSLPKHVTAKWKRFSLIAYIFRRLAQLIVILLGSSFLIYNLTAISGDPLEELKLSQDPMKELYIAAKIEQLQLDVPPPIRWFLWLRGILGVFIGQFTLGYNVTGSLVTEQLGLAIPTTFRLVITATLLSIVVGILIGVVTALRQYSRFDYTITFISFLFFSLPIFWVAVLLKQFLAIGFNDFLANPTVTLPWLIGIGLFSGVFWAGIIGGSRKTILLTFGAAAASSIGLLVYLDAINWFTEPGLGPFVILFLGVGLSVAVTAISTGLKNRAALYASLTQAALGLIFYFVMQPIFNLDGFSGLWLFGLAISSVLVGVITGRIFGKQDPGPVMRTSGIAAFLIAGVVALDRFMQTWDDYFKNEWVNGRPIATVGEATTDISGDYWLLTLDAATHLFLPTMALMIISFAGYVRFTRGSLLEVLNQDYIRTARAKGLNERTVVMRHGFRNALIPITTIMVADFAGVIGGAVITESVFAWQGMGKLFLEGLAAFDLNTVMGVFIVTSSLAVLANLVADLLYGALDPRIRVNK